MAHVELDEESILKMSLSELALKLLCMGAGLSDKEKIALHRLKAKISQGIEDLYPSFTSKERADFYVATAMGVVSDRWKATHGHVDDIVDEL